MEYQKRDRIIFARMTQNELNKMHEKMSSLGMKNDSEYIRGMVLNGYCITFDTENIKGLIHELRKIGNNLNQYAKKANETGSIYEADIQELQVKLDEIWQDTKEIASGLSSLQ